MEVAVVVGETVSVGAAVAVGVIVGVEATAVGVAVGVGVVVGVGVTAGVGEEFGAAVVVVTSVVVSVGVATLEPVVPHPERTITSSTATETIRFMRVFGYSDGSAVRSKKRLTTSEGPLKS